MELIKTSNGKLINKAFIVCFDDEALTITTSDGNVHDIEEGAFFEPVCFTTVPATSADVAIVCDMSLPVNGAAIRHTLRKEKIIAWRIEDMVTTPVLSFAVGFESRVAVLLPDGNVREVTTESVMTVDEFVERSKRDLLNCCQPKHGGDS